MWQHVKNLFNWIRHNKKPHIIIVNSLPSGKHDVDIQMLHVVFDLLVEYVDKEKPFDRYGWDISEKHEYVADEIRSLYDWWKNDYPLRKSPIDDLDKELIPPLSAINHIYEYPAYMAAMEETIRLDQEWSDEDYNNLIRLIKIRSYLWV